MTINYPKMSQEHLKIRIFPLRIFPLELKDKAKEWFKSIGQYFTSWREMEKCFLRKFYSFDKTNALRRAIREFTRRNDNVSEA